MMITIFLQNFSKYPKKIEMKGIKLKSSIYFAHFTNIDYFCVLVKFDSGYEKAPSRPYSNW